MVTVIYLMPLLILIDLSISHEIPEGFDYRSERDNKIYFGLLKLPLTYRHGERLCAEVGGTIVKFQSQEESWYLTKTIGRADYWLHKVKDENSFADGTPITFKDETGVVLPNTPDCIIVRGVFVTGWHNARCDERARTICEVIVGASTNAPSTISASTAKHLVPSTRIPSTRPSTSLPSRVITLAPTVILGTPTASVATTVTHEAPKSLDSTSKQLSLSTSIPLKYLTEAPRIVPTAEDLALSAASPLLPTTESEAVPTAATIYNFKEEVNDRFERLERMIENLASMVRNDNRSEEMSSILKMLKEQSQRIAKLEEMREHIKNMP